MLSDSVIQKALFLISYLDDGYTYVHYIRVYILLHVLCI